MTQQDLGANKFTLADDSGSTQIIYYPHAPGPILVGQGAGPRVPRRLPDRPVTGTDLLPGPATHARPRLA